MIKLLLKCTLCFMLLTFHSVFSVKKLIGDVHTSAVFIQPLVNLENEIVSLLQNSVNGTQPRTKAVHRYFFGEREKCFYAQEGQTSI